MALPLLTDHSDSGLPAHDGLKLAGLFVVYALGMLAVMCFAVYLATSS